VAGGLRNEDYVAFLDESGKDDLQVVSGVLIPARWLRSAERRWQDFVKDQLGSRSGLIEVKSRELIKGRSLALHAQQRQLAKGFPPRSAAAAGRVFYSDALRHISRTREIRTLSVGLRTRRPIEVYHLWFWMAYALLVEKKRAPRPRLPLVVIDGTDRRLRHSQDLVAWRFYKAFPRVQPYVGAGSNWFVGGAVLQESQLHPFIQMADLVAGSARFAMEGGGQSSGWYKTYLDRRGQPVDVSSYALTQIKRRSKKDACGSGWKGAILPL